MTGMNDTMGTSDTVWDRGWTENKIHQLVRLSRLSFAEKLAWLDGAQKLVNELSRGRNSSRVASASDLTRERH